jgi:hypothetical protein
MIRAIVSLCALPVLATVLSCATAETPGEHFRQDMRALQKHCNTHDVRPGETTCDILKLQPADPLSTPAGRFAQSIKLPAAAGGAANPYRPGMTSDEYFQTLCKEAGEFVFKKVSHVEGVMQLRPREIATDQMLRHLYAIEDPYGYRDWEARDPEFFYVNPRAYRFMERPVDIEQPLGKVVRYYGYDGRNPATMKSDTAEAASSRYGFIWRDITRPNDREMGIAGGELIVLDLKSKEVLAVKRGFAHTGFGVERLRPYVWWKSAKVCLGDSNKIYALSQFVVSVLTPAQR